MSLSQNLFGVVARLIAVYIHLKPACTSGKCCEFTVILSHGIYRGMSRDDCRLTGYLLTVHSSAHLHYVCKNPSGILLWYLYFKCIHRFQQDTFRHHKALSHRPVCRLSEISTLSVLLMCATRSDAYLHIRDWRSRKHSPELTLLKMGEYQSLPVLIQYILAANAVKAHSTAIFHRFKQQMYLCVVPERFKMSYTHDWSRDRLLV